MTANATLTARTSRAALPIVNRLRTLAIEFDQAGDYYARFPGSHNALLREESRRAAAQLRFVAVLVIERSYSQTQAVAWARAAWRVINAIGRSNIG